MNKFYLFFIFLFSSQIFAQNNLTYLVDVQYYRFSSGCSGYNGAQTTRTCDINTHQWTLRDATTNIVTENMTSSPIDKTYAIPLSSTYNLSALVSCGCSGGVPFVPYYQCNTVASGAISNTGYTYNGTTSNAYGIEKSIKEGGNLGGFSISPSTQICIGTVILKNLRPNGVSIMKPGYDPNPNGVPTPLEIIAGQTVDIQAVTPASSTSFPDMVFHWQYSLDNQNTWIEIPNTVINGLPTNYTKTPRFTMENIMGADHVNHFGTIHFSIGYGSRLFTNVITVNYSPGTVVIKDRKYEAPDCYKDAVKSIIAYFDRPLAGGEILSPVHIIPFPKNNGDTPRLEQDDVTSLVYDPVTKWYTYAFNILPGENLENREYTIEYQSKLNGVPKGTLTSSTAFLYQNPEQLKFEVVNAINPQCTDDKVEVAIKVTGGSNSYKFYVDNKEQLPTPVKEADGFYHIRGLLPSDTNNIIVTDSKGCIEKPL